MAELTDFHHPNEAAWRHFFFERIKLNPNRAWTFVEIGSYEGSSALWIMNNLLLSPESRLICIDAWSHEGGDERYEGFLQTIGQLPGRDRIEVIRSWSHEALLQLIARGVKADFMYVDGGHDAPTVLRDLVLGFQVLKPGGVMICDDYLWNDARWGGHRTLGRPKIAIDAFTTIYADKIKMVWGMPNVQTWFQKIAD